MGADGAVGDEAGEVALRLGFGDVEHGAQGRGRAIALQRVHVYRPVAGPGRHGSRGGCWGRGRGQGCRCGPQDEGRSCGQGDRRGKGPDELASVHGTNISSAYTKFEHKFWSGYMKSPSPPPKKPRGGRGRLPMRSIVWSQLGQG